MDTEGMRVNVWPPDRLEVRRVDMQKLAGTLRGCANALTEPTTRTTLRDLAKQLEDLGATRF